MSSFESNTPFWKQKRIITAAIVTALAIVVIVLFINNNSSEDAPIEVLNPQVKLTTANAYLGGESISLIGNVRAFTEAAVTSERSGRVVRVNVTLGQTVGAGQVLATLENASESAAILQAQGAYDAAVASKAQAIAAQQQTTVGVDESQNAITNAQNAAVNAYKSAYTTVNGIVLNNIDQFFTSPNGMVPGLRVDGKGETSYLNSERVAYQQLLPTWQQSANALSVNSDLPAALSSAEANIERTLTIVDTFVSLFNRQSGNGGRYTDAELQSFSATFNGLRSQLLASKSNLEAAALGLKNAKDSSTRADISVSVSGIPAADAQIKQALGSLRSAQASYAKTVLRTPISGTVNEISLKAGDYVNPGQKIGEVANNNALEIVTFVGDTEVQLLTVGDVVFIENEYEGRISQIAPSVDSTTRKTEVRIATENTAIKNGDTVTITKEIQETANTSIIVPLTAVKFEIEDGYIFTVEDGKLVQNNVKLGVVRGSSVEILDGLTAVQEFVVDARGLVAGNEVSVSN